MEEGQDEIALQGIDWLIFYLISSHPIFYSSFSVLILGVESVASICSLQLEQQFHSLAAAFH